MTIIDIDMSAGYSARRTEIFLNWIGSSKKVLDIDYWTGGYEVFINNYARQITAIDIEEKALKVARKSFPRIKFLKASVLKLPFSNRSFDVVTMWAVIEHIPEGSEVKALKEINRVLKPKGMFF